MWEAPDDRNGPVEITLDTEQKMASLKIVASLKATDKFGEATIKIVA